MEPTSPSSPPEVPEPSSSSTSSSSQPEQRTKLFVGGISSDTQEKDLEEHFRAFGELKQVMVLRDRVTGIGRGFGFVLFAHPEGAENALKNPKHVILRRTSYFEKFGSVVDTVVIYDNVTQRPRGFGFITFSSEDSVAMVLQKSFHELDGKPVQVKIGVPKDDTNSTPFPHYPYGQLYGGVYNSGIGYRGHYGNSGSPWNNLTVRSRTARYIPVRQLTGTWIGRYRAVPLKSAIGGRLKKKRKRRKKKRRRSTSRRARLRIAVLVAHMRLLSLHGERDRGDVSIGYIFNIFL
ncbi:hypothetical protein B296_00026935 [Ensete ventricosum]|uniref:RRM domain-containing protein n=1 Tax=Ensete ventricosum TaxID=4639 RepID=A0A426YTG8_ENSVE|nr:hypothetical protein B296_00026935 [Ensete ventricosum]